MAIGSNRYGREISGPTRLQPRLAATSSSEHLGQREPQPVSIGFVGRVLPTLPEPSAQQILQHSELDWTNLGHRHLLHRLLPYQRHDCAAYSVDKRPDR